MSYLVEEEWSEVVSFITEESNRHTLEKVFKLMNIIWNKIQLNKPSQLVISTAMIYFHRYFLINPTHCDKDIDKILIGSACLFLAAKSTNSLVHADRIVDAVKAMCDKKSPEKYSKEFIKEALMTNEFEVLSAMGFDCNWQLAYGPMAKIKSVIGESLKVDFKKFCELWTFYINDSFILPVCLYYIPEVIALATLSLLCEKFNIGIDLDLAIKSVGIGNIALRDIEGCLRILRLLYKDEREKLMKAERDKEKDIEMQACNNMSEVQYS